MVSEIKYHYVQQQTKSYQIYLSTYSTVQRCCSIPFTIQGIWRPIWCSIQAVNAKAISKYRAPVPINPNWVRGKFVKKYSYMYVHMCIFFLLSMFSLLKCETHICCLSLVTLLRLVHNSNYVYAQVYSHVSLLLLTTLQLLYMVHAAYWLS